MGGQKTTKTRLHLRKMLCHRINTTLNSNIETDFFSFYTNEDCHNA
jgi:hypothetical protein